MISHDFAPRSDAMKQTSIRNKQHRQRGVAKGLDLQFDHVAAARFADDCRPDLPHFSAQLEGPTNAPSANVSILLFAQANSSFTSSF